MITEKYKKGFFMNNLKKILIVAAFLFSYASIRSAAAADQQKTSFDMTPATDGTPIFLRINNLEAQLVAIYGLLSSFQKDQSFEIDKATIEANIKELLKNYTNKQNEYFQIDLQQELIRLFDSKNESLLRYIRETETRIYEILKTDMRAMEERIYQAMQTQEQRIYENATAYIKQYCMPLGIMFP
mgnify:CR=1 FL=1